MASDITISQKFGYDIVMEKAAIRARLIAAGQPDDMTLLFEVEREYIAAHANDPTFKERSAVWLAKQKVSTGFTREELERLIEHFENANDPMLISIREKAVAQLASHAPSS